MAFSLSPLPYDYNALSNSIDATTMEIHYTKHHQGYVNKLNKAVEGTEAESLSLEDLIKNISKFGTAVRNNGGGHYNHSLFWESLSPEEQQPSGSLLSAIESRWGSFEEFTDAFAQAAATRFGSGWAWLIVKSDGTLEVTSTPNQDNPLMNLDTIDQGYPLLGLDVWEHAYYLKYQNKRPEYINAFWNIVNWQKIGKRYAAFSA